MIKRISWISQECFIDVDIPIIRYLKESYEIRLIIVMPYNATIGYEDYISTILRNYDHIDIEYIYLKNRVRSLKNIKDYYKIINKAKSFKPDLYYISFTGMPFGVSLFWTLLPMKKCILACHNVSTPKGATNEKIAEIYKNFSLKIFPNIQVFSEGQYQVLYSMHRNKNVLLAYLMLKDYGEPTIVKIDDGIVRFLFFGNIVRYKRLDLLIEAVTILVERGVKNFKVTIAGKSKDWDYYKRKMKYPEMFKIRIERIPNEDVANLFVDNHYFVMPYQDIAQRGAITVAFRYNIPTIVSDIPQFNEFVIDGKTTLTFKSQDAISLADTMEYAIVHHREIYGDLCENQKKLVEERFADDAIVDKYRTFFDKLIAINDK